ncbi:MAG: redoxin domain-containing protein [Chloroflexota bacterium]
MVTIAVGEQAPTFELPDQQGRPWNLIHHLNQGSVVLVFYRGDW